MASLPESSTFDAGVYQLETTDPVIGGPSGVSNTPLKNLANRTKYLKDHVDALESSRAPLASPAFTGTPTAPTPSNGDNDTQLATTAFVHNTIGGVLNKSVAGGANVTLTAAEAGNGILIFNGILTANITIFVPDTPTRTWVVSNNCSGGYSITMKISSSATGVAINQGKHATVFSNSNGMWLALTDLVALGAAPVSHSHAEYAPLASPALTGAPTAPTAAQGTNTTQVATTAFVKNEISAQVPAASETVSGLVELATSAEVDTGTATTRAVTPAGLQAKKASDQKYGLVRLATSAEAQAMADQYAALVPYSLNTALKGSNQSLSMNGYQKLPGGLILQWGRLTNASYTQTAYTVTFPIAFPNAFLNGGVALAQAGWNSDSPSAVILSNANSPLSTSMQIGAEYYSVSGIVGDIFWYAIGY